MRHLITLLTLALLTGCSTQTRVETVEVSVPVPVPCVAPSDVPDIVSGADQSVTKDSPPGEKITAVLVEREQLRESDSVFRALIKGCLTEGDLK